jgi:hypothetical protein
MSPFLEPIRRRVRQLGESAAALDALLAENGDRIDLTPDQAAKLLLKLQPLSRKLEHIADELGDAVV